MHKRTTCFATLVFAVVLGGLVHSSCSPANASGPATWVPTGNLNIARSFHTATLLSNGKVLVVGGADDNGDVRDSAELYDPATGTWSITGRPNVRRAGGHTATLLPDGRVLVVGGVNIHNSLDNAELYDPGTSTWKRTGTAIAYPFDHTATLLRNGKVLFAGGASSASALYDPGTETWSNAPGLITPRAAHQATLLRDGRVLVTGGSNDPDLSVPLASAEIFDPASGVWSKTASLDTLGLRPTLRTATLLPNGRVLVAGEANFAGLFDFAGLLDPAHGEWIRIAFPRAWRVTDTATLLRNGKVLVTGGWLAGDDGSEPLLASTELYDWSTDRWADAGDLNTARFGHTATLLSNGKVLVAGGAGVPRGARSVRALQSAELYESGRSTIAAGFTGSWFNPEQNGHGFALEVLSGDPPRLLASWFTFAPQGGQAWIVGLGPITGDRAVLQGIQSVGPGGRFPPNFDAANVRQQDWGTLTFTFSDCNHGRVDWNSTTPGYTNGGMDLTRLTLPAGLACE